jgi:hypothetical protein
VIPRANWQVGWLLALEDTIHVAGGSLVDNIKTIGDQAAAGDVVASSFMIGPKAF